MSTVVSPPEPTPAEPPPARPRPGWLRRSWDKHWYAWAMVAPGRDRARRPDLLPAGRGGSSCRSPTSPRPTSCAEICTKSHHRRPRSASPTRTAGTFVGLDNYVRRAHGRGRRVLAAVPDHAHLDRRLRGLPLRHRPGPGRAAQPADARARPLPGAADPAVGRARLRRARSPGGSCSTRTSACSTRCSTAVGLEPVALVRPPADCAVHRDRRQHLARRAVHDGRPARRPADHPRRALRGGRRSTAPPPGSASATSRCPACARSA